MQFLKEKNPTKLPILKRRKNNLSLAQSYRIIRLEKEKRDAFRSKAVGSVRRNVKPIYHFNTRYDPIKTP